MNTDPTPAAELVDVYVRTRNVLREGMRTEEVADGVHLDWQTVTPGVEELAGVEVIGARGVEVDGLDVKSGRPHGVGPAVGGAGTATPADPQDAEHRPRAASGGIVPGDWRYDRLAELVHNALFYEDDTDGPIFRWSEQRMLYDDDPWLKTASDAVVRMAWEGRREIISLLAAAAPADPEYVAGPEMFLRRLQEALTQCSRHLPDGARVQLRVGGVTAELDTVTLDHNDESVELSGAAATPGEPGPPACEDTSSGLFGATLGPCVRRGTHRFHRDGRGQSWGRLEPSPPTAAERVETAARLLHDRRHPLGSSDTCDRCRGDARAVAEILTREESGHA